MSPELVLTVGKQALNVTVLLSAPLLLSALAVGLLVSLFQAASQINEMTLTFIPKLLGLVAMIYRLKITLAEIEPPIWREVEVSDITLGDLHDVVQAAMGWENYHMHEFFIDDKAYADVSTADPEMKSGDEDRIRLSEIFAGRKNATIRYMYDFGDSWLHAITLQACTEPQPKVTYPRCVEGARACPPEDCGGPWGYADFLDAISDKTHENHKDMKEWIGGKFDPEKFSMAKVNKDLKKLA